MLWRAKQQVLCPVQQRNLKIPVCDFTQCPSPTHAQVQQQLSPSAVGDLEPAAIASDNAGLTVERGRRDLTVSADKTSAMQWS